MFQERGRLHKIIHTQTQYFQQKEKPQQSIRKKIPYIKTQKSWNIFATQNTNNRKLLQTAVTLKVKESERGGGAAASGININRLKLKMANTLSVMTNVLRNVVSKQRRRYKEKGFNLDLAYIYDNIIAMGYPADNIESIYRNRLEDVYKFLQENHQDHYKIYNLCLERSYDRNKFHGRVAVYPFEDHNPPTIELIQRFCMDVDGWLKADSHNVAAVHCKAGKGRTGTMICCYLLYSGLQRTAEDALECYDEKRTKDRKGVTIPSQRRYVQYFAKLIRSGVPYEKRILQFCEIRFTEANVLHSHGTVQCSISVLEDNAYSVKVESLLVLPIDFRKSYTLDIKNHSLCVAGDIKVELAHKRKLFHFWFNTYFVRDAAVIEGDGEDAKLVYTLNKCEIDDAHKDKEHKSFSEDFKVQLVFYAETSRRPCLQANVNSIASQIGNQRKSQSARLSQQSGGGDSSSSSNCQLPQNNSSGSDLNYICDQKSSSSASASVSSLAGPMVGDGGTSNCGASIGDPTNVSYARVDKGSMGARLQQHQQQQLNVSNNQPRMGIKNVSGVSYDYDEVAVPFGQISAAPAATFALPMPLTVPLQQQHIKPQPTYVNLNHMIAAAAADKQHLQLIQQQHQHMKSLLTSAPNHKLPAAVSNSFVMTGAIQPHIITKYTGSSSIGSEYAAVTVPDGCAGIIPPTPFQRDSNRPIDGAVTSTPRINGMATVSEANGCISGANSHSSSSASTTSSSSSAPTSAGDQDCEEDWESGECHPKKSHTVAHNALLLSTLLASSKPTSANSTTTISTITTTSTSVTSLTQTSIPITTLPKLISTSISPLPSTFYLNINSNSGSYNCSYSCDDDENYPHLKCECEHVRKSQRFQKINSTTCEQRSSCAVATVAFDEKVEVAKETGFEGIVENSTGTGIRPGTAVLAEFAHVAIDTANAMRTNVIVNEVDVIDKNAQCQPLITGRHKHFMQMLLAPKTNSPDVISNSNKGSDTSSVGSVVSSWSRNPLFRRKSGDKIVSGCGGASSAAITITKSSSSANSYLPVTADAVSAALSCSPASGCGGLASTSRRKLKNKLKKNTMKLSRKFDWFQNYFRTDPVEFCENFVQHTTAMRRNSNCSSGSRSHKMSISSTTTTGTPTSSFSKRQLLTTSTVIRTHGSNCSSDRADAVMYNDCADKGNFLKTESIPAIASRDGANCAKMPSPSMTASNTSLSPICGNDGNGGSDSSDVFEDFYSSICDNQLSFNNSPCKSPRSLGDIVMMSDARERVSTPYSAQLNEENAHLQIVHQQHCDGSHMERDAQQEPQQQQQQQQHHQELNVVIVAAKPAKTHAIGFNVAHVKSNATVAGEVEINSEADNKQLMDASNMTVGANITIITTNGCLDEENQKHGIAGSRYVYNANILNDMRIDGSDDDEDGGTTSSSIYLTPPTLGIDDGDGVTADGGESANQSVPVFVFSNMRTELETISNSDANKSEDGYISSHFSGAIDVVHKSPSSSSQSADVLNLMILEQGTHAERDELESLDSVCTDGVLATANASTPSATAAVVPSSALSGNTNTKRN